MYFNHFLGEHSRACTKRTFLHIFWCRELKKKININTYHELLFPTPDYGTTINDTKFRIYWNIFSFCRDRLSRVAPMKQNEHLSFTSSEGKNITQSEWRIVISSSICYHRLICVGYCLIVRSGLLDIGLVPFFRVYGPR